jgi:hypothetical protein
VFSALPPGASVVSFLEHELRQLAAVQRQLDDLLVRDDLSDARVARLDERRGALNRDRLRDLPELQRHVERRVRVHLQDEAGLDELPEALQLCLEPVGTDRQVLQDVRALLAADRAARQPRIGLGHGDRDARQTRAALVLDVPVDLRGGDRLCRGSREEQENDQQSAR